MYALLSQGGTAFGEVVLWIGVLIVATLVLGFGIALVRRRLYSPTPPAQETWTLEELRAMRDEGDLTDQEYERLRTRALGGASTRGPTAESD